MSQIRPSGLMSLAVATIAALLLFNSFVSASEETGADGLFGLTALNGTACTATDGSSSIITMSVLDDGTVVAACPSSIENKIVFVTSSTYTGTLGGIAGADSLCQTHAARAGLPGVYKAWLGTREGWPAITFTQPIGDYVLTDKSTIASSMGGQDLSPETAYCTL